MKKNYQQSVPQCFAFWQRCAVDPGPLPPPPAIDVVTVPNASAATAPAPASAPAATEEAKEPPPPPKKPGRCSKPRKFTYYVVSLVSVVASIIIPFYLVFVKELTYVVDAPQILMDIARS